MSFPEFIGAGAPRNPIQPAKSVGTDQARPNENTSSENTGTRKNFAELVSVEQEASPATQSPAAHSAPKKTEPTQPQQKFIGQPKPVIDPKTLVEAAPVPELQILAQTPPVTTGDIAVAIAIPTNIPSINVATLSASVGLDPVQTSNSSIITNPTGVQAILDTEILVPSAKVVPTVASPQNTKGAAIPSELASHLVLNQPKINSGSQNLAANASPVQNNIGQILTSSTGIVSAGAASTTEPGTNSAGTIVAGLEATVSGTQPSAIAGANSVDPTLYSFQFGPDTSIETGLATTQPQAPAVASVANLTEQAKPSGPTKPGNVAPTGGAAGQSANPVNPASISITTPQISLISENLDRAQISLLDTVKLEPASFELELETELNLDRNAGQTASQPNRAANGLATQTGLVASQLAASKIGSEAVGQFAARLAGRVANGSSKFEMRLDPPQMGRIEVKLEVTSDNRVHATLTAERPEVLQDLQRGADALRRALISEGLDLGSNDLSFQLEQQGEGAGQYQQFERTAEAQTTMLDTLMEEALVQTQTEIDTGLGYLLVPETRIDIQA
ncbi:MAG: hypothetical protein COA47_08310 [Robiginitomaculum sp.]|nr:MAG: hypothetical protein COA47_08310 [Robiginitomaculum sp.]